MPSQSLVLAVSSDTNHRSTKPRNKPSVMPIMIRHSTAVTVRIDLAWLTDNKPRERETSVREIMRWRGDNFAGITQETIYISNISISYFTRNFSSVYHFAFPSKSYSCVKFEETWIQLRQNFIHSNNHLNRYNFLQFLRLDFDSVQTRYLTGLFKFITNYYILKGVE